MRGLPVERSRIDYQQEWRNYYAALEGDEAKWGLFVMLKRRRDRNADGDAGKVLAELIERWMREKS